MIGFLRRWIERRQNPPLFLTVRDWGWWIASSETGELPPEGLLAVFRYSDHADPMLCVCGYSWGWHSGPDIDHEFRYDRFNPANRIKRDLSGHLDVPS